MDENGISEVEKGCAPDDKNLNKVYKTNEGPWNEYGKDTFYCNTKLCNGSTKLFSALMTPLILTFLLVL